MRLHKQRRITIPEGVDPLYQLVFRGMIEKNLSYEEMVTKSGHGWSTLGRLRTRNKPVGLAALRDLLNTVGYDIVAVSLKDKKTKELSDEALLGRMIG